jgi:hypothetical protein
MTLPDMANKIVDATTSTPVLLAIMVINIVVLIGFGLVLRESSNAAERRDAMIERCMQK